MISKLDKNEWKSDYILREIVEKYNAWKCNNAFMQKID
jgi:hypothetical protein